MSILFLIGRFILGNWKIFAIGGLLIGYTLYWEHHGAVRVQKRWDAEKAIAQAEFDRVQAAYTGLVGRIERDAAIHKERIDAAYEPIKQRAHDLPPLIRNVAVAPAVIQLLDSARIAATAGPAPEPAKAPDPDSAVTQGQLTDWAIDVLRIHRECTDRVAEWESFYGGLRQSQKESP